MAGYTTSTNVATILSTSFSASTDPTDTEVVSIIARVQAWIDQETGRIWTSATTSEYHDTLSDARLSWSNEAIGAIQDTYFLRKYPIISVQTVRENISGLSGEQWETRSSGYGGNYLVDFDIGAIRFHDNYPAAGRRNVYVSYTYGVGVVPDDIKYACELFAAEEVLNALKRASDQEGLKSVSIGDASYDFGDLERQAQHYRERAMHILYSKGYYSKGEWR